jgi:alpha,alpha-trehalose phosphorylase
VQSIVAAEVGDEDRALEYFGSALLLDLADAAGNASDGVHIASAAGVWEALAFGFGGVRDYDGELSITPHLPQAWNSLAFSLRVRDSQLRIDLSHERERYLVEHGESLRLKIRGEPYELERGRPLSLVPRPAAPHAAAVASRRASSGSTT